MRIAEQVRPFPDFPKQRRRDHREGVPVLRPEDDSRVEFSRRRAAAVLKLQEELKAGAIAAITPDGPRGPLREVQPGALHLAQVTGCPIVPVAFGARRKWVFNSSWDEFIVPKPFNRIAVMYGEPITVESEDDSGEKGRGTAAGAEFYSS